MTRLTLAWQGVRPVCTTMPTGVECWHVSDAKTPLTTVRSSYRHDVMNEGYERGSILITSNRAPNQRPGIFVDPLLASAGLDCLLTMLRS